MKKYSIILAIMLFFGASEAFTYEGEAFGGSFIPDDDGWQGERLGSMDEVFNNPFMQGDGSSETPYVIDTGDGTGDFGPGTNAEEPGPAGWFSLPGTNGGFKVGDYIDFYGEIYVLVQDPNVPYPYLVLADPGTGIPIALGGMEPWFRMPVGDGTFGLLSLLLSYGVFRSFKQKRKSNN